MINFYSDCIKHKLFSKIPAKKKYTKWDVDNLMVESLFDTETSLTESEVVFMKSDVNGCSTCAVGSENYESYKDFEGIEC
jgi:hypothetical protein